MSAVRNDDGSVLVNGVRLSASEVEAVKNAKPVFRPLVVTTGSGRKYGLSGEPRYGVWFDGTSWHALNKMGKPIPGTSWKTTNLNRAKFEFRKPS